jgi:hypothetical protein
MQNKNSHHPNMQGMIQCHSLHLEGVYCLSKGGGLWLGIIENNLTNNNTVKSNIVVAIKQIDMKHIVIEITRKEMSDKGPIAVVEFDFSSLVVCT